MRRLFYISICIVFLLPKGYGQRRGGETIRNLPNYDRQIVHFGFLLGMNTMNFVIKDNPNIKSLDSVYVVQSTPDIGFSLGVVTNLHLGDNFDLRFMPGLSFGSRNVNYTLKLQYNDTSQFTPFVKKVESTYLEFPLLMKFKSKRYGNFRAYVIGGGRYSLDLASQAKTTDDGKQSIKLKRSDYYYEIGFGLDFYLEYFKFSTEVKAAWGIRDMLKRENHLYSQSIDALRAKSIYISFLFE